MPKIWINNGIVETLISKEDIIPKGYVNKLISLSILDIIFIK